MEEQEYLIEKHTFSDCIVFASDDTDDNDGNDDDCQGSNYWHYQVDIGQEGHQLGFKITIANGASIVIDLSGRSQGS